MIKTLFLKDNTHTFYIGFIISLVFHILITCTLFFFIHQSEWKPISADSTKVYSRVELISAPQPTPKAPSAPQIHRDKSIKPKLQTGKLLPRLPPDPQPAPTGAQTASTQTQKSPSQESNTEQVSDNSIPVLESLATQSARCPTPEIKLSQDAINAGVSSGKIVLQVEITSEGKIRKATLLKGTGYAIDQEMIQLVKTLNCIPAKNNEKNISVIKRLQWIIMP